jgi:hypothetical protein
VGDGAITAGNAVGKVGTTPEDTLAPMMVVAITPVDILALCRENLRGAGISSLSLTHA